MRVTNRYISNNIISNIQQNLRRLARTQEQLSTGKTMLRPSDKPQSDSQLLSVKASISYLEQYDKNLDDGLSYLNLSDSSMQTLGNLLNSASEMAVQGANSTYSSSDMAALGEQIDKMIDEVVDLANSSVGGRFIYAGTKNSVAPFSRSGDKIVYKGDTNGIYRQVISGDSYRIDAPGITTGTQVAVVPPTAGVTPSGVMPTVTQRPSDLTKTGIVTITCDGSGGYSITGATALDGVTPVLVSDFSGLNVDATGTNAGEQYKITIDNRVGVFGHGEETSPGSGQYVVYDPTTAAAKSSVDTGIFDCLFKLRDALNSGNYTAVSSSVSDVQAKMDQLLQRRVAVGSRTNHFEMLKDQINDLNTKLTSAQNNLEGADMYKLSIQMSDDQVTYQASLSSAANMMKVSLLDYLK